VCMQVDHAGAADVFTRTMLGNWLRSTNPA
jgi:hypothetical protein